MCLQFHPINSIESTVPKTRKRVFHIPDKYEIVFENSAQICAAILAKHLGYVHSLLSDNLFSAKPDFGRNLLEKLPKVNISANL